jgi:hypothetical protein
MKNYEKMMKNKVLIILQILVYAAIIFALLGWDKFIGPMTNIAVWLITSIIITGVVQIIIQKFSGDFLEKIPLTFEIKGIKISVTLFFIITIILKLLLF